MDTVALVSEDGQRVEVTRDAAQRIGILQPLLALPGGIHGAAFPLHAVTGTVLAKVLEYVEHHKSDPAPQSPRDMSASSDSFAEEAGDSDSGASGSDEESTSSLASDDEQLFAEYVVATSPWDQRFMDTLDLASLVELTKAANYLNVPGLLDLCCRTLARQMTGLRASELRAKFNLPNDFTPEEEARMAAEFAWVDE